MTPPEDDKGPDYKPTAQLEKPPAWAISIMERMNTGFASLERRLDLVESNVDITGSTVRELSSRVTRVEDWRLALDERINRHSGGTRQLSQNDAKQDAELANERVAREALAGEVAAVKAEVSEVKTAVVVVQAAVAENTIITKKAITGFFKEHPQLVTGFVALLTAAMGAAIHWLSAGGH